MAKLASRELNAISEELYDRLVSERTKRDTERKKEFESSELYKNSIEKFKKILEEVGMKEEDYEYRQVMTYINNFLIRTFYSNNPVTYKSIPNSNAIRRKIILSEIGSEDVNIEELFNSLKQEIFNT